MVNASVYYRNKYSKSLIEGTQISQQTGTEIVFL